MTLLWFIIWLISDLIGDKEPLLTDPVNAWTATLILAAALDLARQHVPATTSRQEAKTTQETG